MKLPTIIILVFIFGSCIRTQPPDQILDFDAEATKIRTIQLETTLDFVIENELAKLNNSYIYTRNGDSLLLNALVNKSPKIVLFISEQGCSNCIIDQLEMISENPFQEFLSEMVIITNSPNYRSVLTFLKTYNLAAELYFTYNDLFGITQRSGYGPFYFILDSDLLAKRTYYPIYQDSIRTKKYLSTLIHLLAKS